VGHLINLLYLQKLDEQKSLGATASAFRGTVLHVSDTVGEFKNRSSRLADDRVKVADERRLRLEQQLTNFARRSIG
jgi:hypothetical protein